jgi:NADPH-dependent 2,4-dienoyl-CoA reductase/sulfur reductase-like enzyme
MSLRLYANHPLLTHALPGRTRSQVFYTTLGPAGAYWLRPRFEDRVDARLGCSVAGIQEEDGRVRLELQGTDGTEELVVKQIVAGTGYRADLKRLPFLEDRLRSRIASVNGAPVLDRCFESSVPNLYFVGYLAGLSFGPVMRFVFGTEFTARRVSRGLARRSTEGRRLT